MKKHFILSKDIFLTANRLSLKKITALLVLTLFFGISPLWGAKQAVKLYVDAFALADGDGMCWETAFNDLQDALDDAASGDEIWVAVGTYKPTKNGDRTASFILKSGVKIYGGFSGDEDRLTQRQLDPSLPAVLSGDIGISGDDTDNSYHVVYADGVTDAVLDGFTVTDGRGDGGGNYKGAGMYNNKSSLTIANCTFSNNRVAVRASWINGAGAGMYNHYSAPIVSNCTFIANQAGNAYNNSMGRGGGMYNEGYFLNDNNDLRWPIVTGCTFSDNLASSTWNTQIGGGGGMYNYDCSLTIDSCTFAGNLAGCGGGMLNSFGMPTITNCIFNTNSSSYSQGYGGAIYNMGYAAILNCTFYQNGWRLLSSGPEPLFKAYTAVGGAIFDYRAGSTITNCIFTENAVRNHGGAVDSDAIRPPTTLTNCLFYENKSWQGYQDPRAEVISHVSGNIADVNNLYDIDPLLVDPAGGDLHLLYDSPCIDAGYALRFGYLPGPYPPGITDTDFEGDKRIVDSDGDSVPAIDIGVDEFIPNLPDLRAILEDLADSGELDEATATRLFGYVDDAQTALYGEEEETAINILNELIADVRASIGDTETTQIIEMKTKAVIEEI